MNLDKINKKIKKISLLIQTFDDNSSISVLERDLLLSYIRELYELSLDNMPNADVSIKTITENPNKIIHPNEVVEFIEPHAMEEPVAHNVKEEINRQAISEPMLDKIESGNRIQDTIEPLVHKVVDTQKNENHLSAEVLEQIFKEEKVNELSDKLSMSPINDIRKGLGLNERLFTQKELFNDSSERFNEVLDKINNATSYEEAKSYLLDNVIPVYQWDTENKIKKAATFVKLVKRRFIK